MTGLETGSRPRQVEPMEPAYKLLTVEEFLDSCPNDQRHYQLFDGIMVAMAPPGGRHQRIAGVLGGDALQRVQSNLPGCAVAGSGWNCAARGWRAGTISRRIVTVSCEPQTVMIIVALLQNRF